jgi:CxxC motif-containing protein (DUF1111 family)
MAKRVLISGLAVLLLTAASQAPAQFVSRDPGLRGGSPGAGAPLAGLTEAQRQVFEAGLEDFQEEDTLASGLGPRFNLDNCAGCHLQPAIGGSSPSVNPQAAIATAHGARNVVPRFITPDGPVREARFKYTADGSRDGGVHALFVVSGRNDGSADASDCTIRQPDFDAHLARGNVVFRIPTPVFGMGLVEQIPDGAIVANLAATARQRAALGVRGRPHVLQPSGNPNRNGNDGTIARFGWKAQNKSALLFAGEAYNVEQGITNELFPTERDETARCQYATVPNDTTNMDGLTAADVLNGIQKFAFFMKFLGPPQPAAPTASSERGRALFGSVGCAVCHTPVLQTGPSEVPALSEQPVALYSDLALHAMGPGLADDIVQGAAGGDEFRTAPLWGLGQRIFLLHDGRTTDLKEAILAHRSAASSRWPASEANQVVNRYLRLVEAQKQDLLNFLRSL